MEKRSEQENNELVEKLNFIGITKGTSHSAYLNSCTEYNTTSTRETIDLEYNAALQDMILMAEQANLINKQ
jgi:hypothetical protein